MAKGHGKRTAQVEKELAELRLTQEGADCAARTAREQLIRSVCLIDLADVHPDRVRQQGLDYARAADVFQGCEREACALRRQLL